MEVLVVLNGLIAVVGKGVDCWWCGLDVFG